MKLPRAIAVGLALVAVSTTPALAQREPLRIDVPSRPLMPNTTEPVLYLCEDLDDCQAQAAAFCAEFNYPNGRILFRDLPPSPRPFPIYTVICFE